MAAPRLEYPTYEDLVQSRRGVRCSLDVLRLRWVVNGRTYVLQDATNPESTQEPYQQSDYTTHPISASALTDPPISCIIVSIHALNEYEDDWLDSHEPHADTGLGHYRNEELIDCCGENRPGPGPTLLVQVPPASFLTIGRFIEVVHPWMSSLEGQIRAARGVHRGRPLPAEVEMFVWNVGLSPLSVLDGPGFWALLSKDIPSVATSRLEQQAPQTR